MSRQMAVGMAYLRLAAMVAVHRTQRARPPDPDLGRRIGCASPVDWLLASAFNFRLINKLGNIIRLTLLRTVCQESKGLSLPVFT